MLDFQIPRITSESVEQNRGTFIIEPLDRGFGYTFGNSLRRVLLSSLAGAAVTSVRIEGVAHEFSTIQGVKEDVTDIVLNLKGIVCRMHSDASEVEAPLVVTGPGEIKAKDIDLPAGVEILNPDVHIATLEKKTKLELYMTIGRGRGYRPAEENKSSDQPIGVIPIDSIFSPVRRVAYAVEQARVGQKTDFDKLTLDIETDGSIDPQAALREAAELLISQLAIFTDADRIQELRAVPGGQLDGHGLAVADAGTRQDTRSRAGLELCSHLVEDGASAEHRRDARLEHVPVQVAVGVEHDQLQLGPARALPSFGQAALPGAKHLEGADHAARVGQVQGRCPGGIARAQLRDQEPQPLGSCRRRAELVAFDRVRCGATEVPSLAERADVLTGPPDHHRGDAARGQPGEDVAGQGEPLRNGERLTRLAHREQVAGHPTQFRNGRCSCPGHQAAKNLA